MVKEHTPSIRYRAVGMVRRGMTQAQAARELGVSVATIGSWLEPQMIFRWGGVTTPGKQNFRLPPLS